MIIPAPSADRCLEFFRRYRMLDNIRAHSLQVARVAMTLTDGLEKAARTVQLPRKDLVLAGALLHDIAKTPCLNGGCDHARAGAEICIKHGYPEIAEIVEQHVILKDYDPTRYCRGEFSALEIVYYADKRVRHDEIVSLDERLEYIVDRYSRNNPELQESIRINFERCVRLEGCLFKFLDFAPEDVAEHVLRDSLKNGAHGIL